jgi:hypothetical protein
MVNKMMLNHGAGFAMTHLVDFDNNLMLISQRRSFLEKQVFIQLVRIFLLSFRVFAAASSEMRHYFSG